MADRKTQVSHAWSPPCQKDILTAFADAWAARPDVVTLTIILKLRTQRGTEALLATTQQRVTNMLHDVTVRFFHDLEHLDTGATYPRLIAAMLDLVTVPGANDAGQNRAIAQLRDELEALRRRTIGPGFVQAIIAAAASVETQDHPAPGWNLLRHALEQWYTEHADKKMTNMVANVAQATTTVKVKDADGNVTTDAQGEPVTAVVARYTPTEVTQIKLAVTLRRALVARHQAQVVTTRAMGMAVLALRQHADADASTCISTAINRRCAGARLQDVIAVLVALVGQQLPATNTDPDERFGEKLAQFAAEWEHRHPKGATQPSRPFLLCVVDALVEADEDERTLPLRLCLEHWHASITPKEWEQRFPVDERQLMMAALAPAGQDVEADRHIGMGLLLLHWLQAHCTLTTDVLLLVSLGEKTIRRLGDGAQLLSGLLSNCYGEVCSSQKYPLAGELRAGVFVNRGNAILGWCQLVADYVVKRDRQRPGNTFPPRAKGAPKQVSLFRVFQGKRVVRLDLAYQLWKREDRAYKEAVAAIVPGSADVGKTLGNPYAHTELRRQFAGQRRRRTTILGWGVVGKRGARRMKTWLLPDEKRTATLKHLDVLLYPQLDWSEAVRVAARQAPHPYWVKRTKRGITAVRPTQFRKRVSKYPQRLLQLSREQQVKLREELREQERYAAQFATFAGHLDRFLDAAPPAPPFIAPVLLTEADMHHLPPEARLDTMKTFESYKAQFDQNLNWYRDVIPTRGSHRDDYSAEKRYDLETTQNRELEWSAATLAQSRPQPIYFKRGMHTNLTPRSFALLAYLRQDNAREHHRFIFACELVGETAAECATLLDKDRARGESTVENFFVNHPDQRFIRPRETTMQFFATQMGADHQERLLLEYMTWRRREPEKTQHLISTARIVSRQRTSRRTDWYVHLPVPLPVPDHMATLDAVIGFHEHAGAFSYAVIDLRGAVLALGTIELPEHARPKRKDGMTPDNFAFETAAHIVRRSMTAQYFHRLNDTPRHYTAFIGIEDTGWKQDLVGTEAANNRQNVSLPRARILEIVTYKALRHGLPLPLSVDRIAPSRDCGHCGMRIDQESGIVQRPVVHCFHCKTLGKPHKLKTVRDANTNEQLQCNTCGRVWQKHEPQFKCSHCRTQQYARYNTALVTVHRTADALVGREGAHAAM